MRIMHGKSGTYEHRVWKGIRTRCFNKRHHSYKNYGGRGIKLCLEWSDFSRFLKDMGKAPTEKHSIDRKNVNGHYDKYNCHWATKKQQMLNTRRNRILVINGVGKPLRTWCDETGIHYDAARQRLDSGLDHATSINPKRMRELRSHCASGHAYDEENTYMYKGMKKCRTCVRAAGRKRDRAKRMNRNKK